MKMEESALTRQYLKNLYRTYREQGLRKAIKHELVTTLKGTGLTLKIIGASFDLSEAEKMYFHAVINHWDNSNKGYRYQEVICAKRNLCNLSSQRKELFS